MAEVAHSFFRFEGSIFLRSVKCLYEGFQIDEILKSRNKGKQVTDHSLSPLAQEKSQIAEQARWGENKIKSDFQ